MKLCWFFLGLFTFQVNARVFYQCDDGFNMCIPCVSKAAAEKSHIPKCEFAKKGSIRLTKMACEKMCQESAVVLARLIKHDTEQRQTLDLMLSSMSQSENETSFNETTTEQPPTTLGSHNKSHFFCDGQKCRPCNDIDCPADTSRFNSMPSCKAKCPPEPNCYGCIRNQCQPMHGFACHQGREVHSTEQKCRKSCLN